MDLGGKVMKRGSWMVVRRLGRRFGPTFSVVQMRLCALVDRGCAVLQCNVPQVPYGTVQQ